jgi:hypothetical protein
MVEQPVIDDAANVSDVQQEQLPVADNIIDQDELPVADNIIDHDEGDIAEALL